MTVVERQSLRGELNRLLSSYRDLALSLRNLLREERRALESPEAEALLNVCAAKSRCVEDLQELESQRVSMCGSVTETDGMRRLFDKIGDCPELDERWGEIIEIGRECQEMNTVNGAISCVRHDHMMRALALLSGNAPAPALYGPEGREEARYRQRGLGHV